MRISSETYRNWSLDEWCKHVSALNVATLSEWASSARSSYNHAVTLGRQRDVARQLGWLPKLEKGEMEIMSDDEFAQRFRSKGVKSMTDMWKSAQHWCEYLRRENRLEPVAEKLGISYIVEWHPCDDVEYYLERCRRVGDLTVWRLLDKTAAEAARKHKLMNKISQQAPRRPPEGFPSAGGNCRSLAELAVARLLEANDEPFVTQLDYPFTFPRGLKHACKSDFYLYRLGAYIEVWGIDPDDDSSIWDFYHQRRRFKTDMCSKLNLRLLEIEGRELFRHGPEIFLQHVEAVLTSAGLKLNITLDRWAAFDPQCVSDKCSNGD